MACVDSPACTLYISCTLVTVNKPLTFNPEKPASVPESVPSALTVTCKTFGQQCYVLRSSAWTICFSSSLTSSFSDENNGKCTFVLAVLLPWNGSDLTSFVFHVHIKHLQRKLGLCTLKILDILSKFSSDLLPVSCWEKHQALYLIMFNVPAVNFLLCLPAVCCVTVLLSNLLDLPTVPT